MQMEEHIRLYMPRHPADTKNRIAQTGTRRRVFGIHPAAEAVGRLGPMKKLQEAHGFIKDGIGTDPGIVVAGATHG